jgi:hypothetical protein
VSGDAVLAGAAAPALGVTLAYAAIMGDGRHFRVGALSMSTGWLAVLATTGILGVGMASAPANVTAAYLAHAGGLAAGWVYLRTAASINLSRLRDGVSPVPDEPDEMPRAIPRGQPRSQRPEDDIVARSNAAVAQEAAVRPALPAPSPEPRDANPLNRVLDKISALGLDSLTADERRLLEDLSRRLRDR